MNLNWILSPGAVYGVLALALLSCLNFFIGIKREIYGLKMAARQAAESAQGSVEDLAREVHQVKQDIQEVEAAPAAALPQGETINLTRRAQVLRMHRRGESIPTIAAALRTPQNEIRLLLKVQDVLNSAKVE